MRRGVQYIHVKVALTALVTLMVPMMVHRKILVRRPWLMRNRVRAKEVLLHAEAAMEKTEEVLLSSRVQVISSFERSTLW